MRNIGSIWIGIVVGAAWFCLAGMASADPAKSDLMDYFTTGKFRPSFDHLGGISGQIEAAAACGCTVNYGGLGDLTYAGLGTKAQLDEIVKKAVDYNRKGHSLGVPVMLCYLCATSIVNAGTFTRNWKDYAPALPVDADPHAMLQQDIHGNNLASWYGPPYNPADTWNPMWRQYQKFCIKLVVQSGHDGVFYDNPTVHVNGDYSKYAMAAWSTFLKRNGIKVEDENTSALREITKAYPRLWMQFRATEVADFLREMRDYGRSLKPDFVLTANNSLNSWDSFYSQPRTMGYSIFNKSLAEDFITIEDMSMSPRLDGSTYYSYAADLRLLAAIGHGKPLSICTIADGNYTTPPTMMQLAIAECTAHDASYLVWPCWEKQYAQANEKAVKSYQGFLETHADLFKNSKPVSDAALIWPYDNWLTRDDCPTVHLAQHLSANNVQYDAICEDDLTEARLSQYKDAIWAAGDAPRKPASQKLLSAFVKSGAKTFEGSLSQPQLANTIAELAKSTSVSITTIPGVRSLVRKSRKGYLLHLYNLNVIRQDPYHDKVRAAGTVDVSWCLPNGVKADHLKLSCLTPDSQGSSGPLALRQSKVLDRTKIAFTVPNLYLWSVIFAEVEAGK